METKTGPGMANAARGPRALAAAIVGLGLFGAALVATPGPMREFFSWIAYGSPERVAGFGPDAVAYVELVHAILGAMTFGWAVTLLGVVGWLWARQPLVAWWIVAGSIGAWYVPDTAYSLLAGFWRNALFNSACALPFAIALAVAYPGRAHRVGTAVAAPGTTGRAP
ncbi:MAG: hypothetical protein O9284_02210 [Steroidobacteraceae bacterium]|jgi:hypothetical protein|nr:hypothetical protein [Steroidobacteraceae bacterium]